MRRIGGQNWSSTMISDENLAQLKAMMMEVVRQIMDEHGFKKPPTAHALRQRRYAERQKSVRTKGAKASAGKGLKRQKSVSSERQQEAIEVLEFLNAETHKKYPPVQTNLEIIEARLNEGYTPVQLRQIVVRKCREWGSDPKMKGFLRPKTIFNKTNAGNYAGELVVPND